MNFFLCYSLELLKWCAKSLGESLSGQPLQACPLQLYFKCLRCRDRGQPSEALVVPDLGRQDFSRSLPRLHLPWWCFMLSGAGLSLGRAKEGIGFKYGLQELLNLPALG